MLILYPYDFIIFSFLHNNKQNSDFMAVFVGVAGVFTQMLFTPLINVM